MSEKDHQETKAARDRRTPPEGGRRSPPARFDLPEIERDDAGIPTFVFAESLPENVRPSIDRRCLEVVLLWRDAVLKIGHFVEPRPVTVGDNLKNDFRVSAEGMPSDRFNLMEVDGTDFVVHWTDTMSVELRGEDGEILDQAALLAKGRAETVHQQGQKRHQYRLGLHDRVAVQVGAVTFVVQYVAPPRVEQTSLWQTIDFYFTKIIGLSFLVHAFTLIAIFLTPIDPTGLSEDLFKNPNRFARLVLKEPEKAKQKKKKFELEGAKGAKHKDEEGKFGKDKLKKKDALASIKGAPRVDPNKREKDRQIALDSGIFAALKGNKGGAVSNIFGPGGLGTGINNALGGLRGTEMGDAGGAGGLGTRGSGPGGGGSSLGIGGLGDGTDRGSGGMGTVDLGGRGAGRYKVIPGRTITKGCLSQQVVGRVIARAHNQARYCYEKELTRNPNLSGKVTTVFTIGSTGGVTSTSISESTMNDKAVEDCLVRVIQRLRFPPCVGGGTAEVTYPWIFKAGGN